ncbi:hypothetical protein [Nitrospira sp. BLG_2]|uniref:hypothetical protein n=1 Tax=Nitrospira sp. BLG_2 TaxID=3397507 RepID=UPI003B9B461F
MPIFSGFEGEKFQFDGIPNKCFNLLTDDSIQVNAHFNSHKRIDHIGIKIGNSKVKWSAQDGKATINGEELYHRSYITVDNQAYHSYVEIKPLLEAVRNAILFVNAGKYHFNIVRNKNCSVVLPYYFGFDAVIYNGNARPHGIVGQTADFNGASRIPAGNQGEGIIEGNPLDYMVSDLWSNDFRYNKFKE